MENWFTLDENGEVHIFVPTLLRMMCVPDTEGNRAHLQLIIGDYLREAYPDVEIKLED